jgi:hypothetical protein
MRVNEIMHGRIRKITYVLKLLLILALILVTTACANIEATTEDNAANGADDNTSDTIADNITIKAELPFDDVDGCNGAVFSSGGGLYVYYAQNGSVREIDEDSGTKQFLGLSPDRALAAYLYSFRSENIYSTAAKIGIFEIASGRTTELELDDYLSQLMNVYWTSDKTIMAVGHLNPSTNIYQAFDVKEGRSLFIKPVGTLFDISSDGSRIIYYFTPHFSEMLLPHLRISGINTEDPDSAVVLDGPVYEVSHPDDCIRQACFAGENKMLFIEYEAENVSHKLKFADIGENSAEIVSEIPFDFSGLDMENILAMEYFEKSKAMGSSEDYPRICIISRDAADSSNNAAAGINLHEFLLKDTEIISVNVVPTGLDISFAHDINITEYGSDIIVTDITGSGDRAYRKIYKYDGKKFYELSANEEVSHEALRVLEEYAGKFIGDQAEVKIDRIELF